MSHFMNNKTINPIPPPIHTNLTNLFTISSFDNTNIPNIPYNSQPLKPPELKSSKTLNYKHNKSPYYSLNSQVSSLSIGQNYSYSETSIPINSNVDLSQNTIINENSNNCKYKTDPNFNFYEELNKNDDEDNQEYNVDNCLISNLPLDKTKIELKCGHKFNYFYIYKETINSKKNNSYSLYNNDKLGSFQIKCPYCRTVYNELLPPSLEIPETQLMNSINKPHKMSMKVNCEHENCNIEKVYVTPFGYYCKRHYYFKKSNGEIDKEFQDDENDKEKINYDESILHPLWKNYTNYKVYDLKQILKANKLKVSGTKPVLITRLLNNNVQLIPMLPSISNYPWHISM